MQRKGCETQFEHCFRFQGEVAFFDDGDRYDGMVEILQQHPGTCHIFCAKIKSGI